MNSNTSATLVITPATTITGTLSTGAGIDLGNADTTLARSAGGLVTIEGNTIVEGPAAPGAITFSGPTQTRAIAVPDANCTLLSTNAAVTVAQGGTGRATGTTAYALVATGTTATGAQQTLAQGATTEILVGGGAALPVWTTATGTGAPVRGTSPTITTPTISGNLKQQVDALAYLTISTADGGATTISQTSDGTDQITIGDNISDFRWNRSNYNRR